MDFHSEEFDVAVVGAGIVGLGVTWEAAKQGARVAVFETRAWAQSASIRNFGMIWPIGQPPGPRRDLALRSAELWKELDAAAGLGLESCGSLHLAHHADEWAVLQQFVEREQRAGAPKELRLLSRDETLQRTGLANPEGLIGSVWSETECRVDAPRAIAGFAKHLQEEISVPMHFGQAVAVVEPGCLRLADGQVVRARQIVVCSGAEFAHLFPHQHRAAGLRLCKLHMMRAVGPAGGERIGPHLASGLTLRHYESFVGLPGLDAVRLRVAEDTPELDRFGIHVMVSQSADGSLVLGDSHEYDDQISPFDNQEIDRLLERELKKVFAIPAWRITARWAGIYAKFPNGAWLELNPLPGVWILNGFGGGGMTMSLGVASAFVRQRVLASPP